MEDKFSLITVQVYSLTRFTPGDLCCWPWCWFQKGFVSGWRRPGIRRGRRGRWRRAGRRRSSVWSGRSAAADSSWRFSSKWFHWKNNECHHKLKSFWRTQEWIDKYVIYIFNTLSNIFLFFTFRVFLYNQWQYILTLKSMNYNFPKKLIIFA